MRLDANISGAPGPGHWFAQAWAMAVSEVVEALDLGADAAPLEVRAAAADPANWAAWSGPLWHTQSWTPGDGAQVWIGCPRTVPRALWSHIGGAEDADADAQSLETFREILNQSAGGVAAEAVSRLGAATQASAAEESAEPDSGWAVELRFSADGQDHTIAIVGNPALAQALNPPAVAGAPPASPLPHAAASPPADVPPSDPLELIREVTMELAVSFGDTDMPLGDVLKLASGAIIELNRSVSDPVEVLVNGSVIARGDVVVVDGNYGVRITEIVSRRDRVRSML